LSYLFPDSADTFKSLAEEDARSRLFAGTQYPSDVAAGMELGAKVGAAAVAFAKADGSDREFTGSFPVTPGVWSNANPVTPLAGTWRAWTFSSPEEVRAPPPPSFGSPEADAQYAEVRTQPRNNAVNHSAWFWQPSFITPWLDTLNREIFEHHWDADPPRAARAYALETIAQHDATLACWANKYAYLELRPSMVDSSIVTLFANPPHPGFPSGHACASGGASAVLGYLFPSDADSLAEMASDAGLSTFYAGIHTRQDVSAGLTLGQAVGEKVVRRAIADDAH
jgi:membrane-associated phospholipid phosphatase